MMYQIQVNHFGRWDNRGEPVGEAGRDRELAWLASRNEEARAIPLGTAGPTTLRRYRVSLYGYALFFGEVEVWAASLEDAERIGPEMDERLIPIAANSWSPVPEHMRTEAAGEWWPELSWESAKATLTPDTPMADNGRAADNRPTQHQEQTPQ